MYYVITLCELLKVGFPANWLVTCTSDASRLALKNWKTKHIKQDKCLEMVRMCEAEKKMVRIEKIPQCKFFSHSNNFYAISCKKMPEYREIAPKKMILELPAKLE